MRVLSPYLYADLIGKPFEAGARGPLAYDCLGLALELQRRQGHALPDFASTEEEFEAQCRDGVLGPCRRIESPVPGCTVLLRMTLGEHHIGTMVDRYCMVHTMRDIGRVCTERLLEPHWRRRVLGYYEVGA